MRNTSISRGKRNIQHCNKVRRECFDMRLYPVPRGKRSPKTVSRNKRVGVCYLRYGGTGRTAVPYLHRSMEWLCGCRADRGILFTANGNPIMSRRLQLWLRRYLRCPYVTPGVAVCRNSVDRQGGRLGRGEEEKMSCIECG